ncbi:ArgE/DapE family deacylase [Caldinitratiruptor microaerophilus]|uniref:Acetylornithine deacetylase n=1 Tax=Caldinitratiruptor microaerophilus TaxID=671077 RepID=A0AA35G9B1_9FIRM|nr:ArgE/DapE family deacylase [Caldinitratiruptor microaerophilus]BDG60109.1 acetylornithine deacetylase [Caldinitratiruptor microaerophilus]
MTRLEKVQAAVRANLRRQADDLISALQDVVRIPSVVGQEGEAQQYMAQLYERLGLEVETFTADRELIAAHPAYCETPWEYAGRPNVLGTLRGAGGGRSLILNGHIDVVSPEPVNQWTYDPWGAQIVGNRMYGRGAMDMKSGLIANYFALKAVLDVGIRPSGTVQLQSVIEEEAGGSGGTLACLIGGNRADGMVVTEPFDDICIGMVGVAYFKVRVAGRTAHAGLAHQGVNAIGKMIPIYQALLDLDEERARRHPPEFFGRETGRSCHLNIGTMQAGDWTSTVPGWAELTCRISFLPGETLGGIRQEVEAVITAAAAADPWLAEHPPVVVWYGWQAEPWLQDGNDPLVVTFKATAERVAGRPFKLVAATAGLDSRFCAYWNIPALNFGPRGERLHGVDEYVEIDSVVEVAEVLASFIVEWCGWQE